MTDTPRLTGTGPLDGDALIAQLSALDPTSDQDLSVDVASILRRVSRERQRVTVRSLRLRVSAAAAAVVLVASGVVAYWSSSPIALSSGFALGAVHPSWVEYSARTTSGATYGTASQSMAGALVNSGRFSTVLRLDGLTIAPLPASVRARVSAAQMETRLWATTSLLGQTKVAFGLGDITLTLSRDGAPKLREVPVWVAIATSKPCSATSQCTAATIATSPLTVVVSGYGLPNTERTTGTPIDFTYRSGGKNAPAKPRLLAAIEQVSVTWLQDGHLTNGRLHITAAAVPCGALSGYGFVTNADVTTLTVRGLIPESTIGAYCTASAAVDKIIPLRGASETATAIRHAPTGPIQATN